MSYLGDKRKESRGYQEPEIRLVNMKTEDYEEFSPIYQNSKNNYSQNPMDSTFKELVLQKYEERSLPLSLRKRLMYEKCLEKQMLEELSESSKDNIMDYIDLQSKIYEIPIVMRKHLMFAKIQNGLTNS